jgi:hypothetical protein
MPVIAVTRRQLHHATGHDLISGGKNILEAVIASRPAGEIRDLHA